jgi:hypothetical protein
VVLGFLAVVGVGHVLAEPGEFDRDRSGQRDALVGRAEQHVELDARGHQALCIELRQTAQLGAVIEETGIEEVGRQAPRLGLELAEAQHAGIDREGHEILGKSVGAGGACVLGHLLGR